MKELKTPWWIPGQLQEILYPNPRFAKYGGEEHLPLEELRELLTEYYKEEQVTQMLLKIEPVVFYQDAVLVNLDESTGRIVCLSKIGEILYCESSVFRWKSTH